MLQKLRNLSPVLLTIFIGGCAVGTHFVRPEPDSLKNGQTKYSQIIERFGIPMREGAVVKNEKNLKMISYTYLPAPAGPAGFRGVGFYFSNDVLVGYEFVSSVAEDHTDFDESKINQIIKGKSTRAEVIALMGRPGGYYIFPMIKPASGEAAVYKYSKVSTGFFTPSILLKSLVVTFDTSGLATDVDYSSSGSR